MDKERAGGGDLTRNFLLTSGSCSSTPRFRLDLSLTERTDGGWGSLASVLELGACLGYTRWPPEGVGILTQLSLPP